MVEIPKLHSERLTFRAWREDDLDPYAEMYGDEDVARFIGGVCDRANAWRKIAAHIGHWHFRGYGMFAVDETATGAFIGFGGPWCPEGWPEPEIGYSLVKAHWGKGYATELATRTRAFAYDELGWSTAISNIAPANAGSKAVAERLGAQFERTITLMGVACDIHRHPSPEQLAKSAKGVEASP